MITVCREWARLFAPFAEAVNGGRPVWIYASGIILWQSSKASEHGSANTEQLAQLRQMLLGHGALCFVLHRRKC